MRQPFFPRHRATLLFVTVAILPLALVAPQSAHAAQNGYCWNDKVGWIDMRGVVFIAGTRRFEKMATFSNGNIDFDAQGQLAVTLSSSANGNGDFPLTGQAFSEQIGWVVANHGGESPAAMKTSGELTGNFWSNEVGWISCSSSDVGASYVHIWNPEGATGGASSASGGGGGGGGRRGGGQAYSSSSEKGGSVSSQGGSVPKHRTVSEGRGYLELTENGVSTLFQDVPVTEWFAPYVSFLLENGIASGYKDAHGNLTGYFGPGNYVTYAEIVKMVVGLVHDGIPAQDAPRNLSAQETWAADYISFAERQGFTLLASSTLNVMLPATRGEVIQLVLEALEIPLTEEVPAYEDVSPEYPHAKSIATATKLGIVSGDDGRNTFRPNEPINRAEVAKILKMAAQRR